ncbi:bifunctional [glutamate--ammonia ligase]-adenylyl-L-tyrosine phosphorylase/[glutamate--ammonia-ligase] adenylyltransferase [Paracidovorax citrulli]|uniref:Bifunctional glutamine synthetase adenylyltransferase/adenylyl-removing enzyme n=2 Tax=Paracidovorax citrulli TaxID=80869 RepID=A1TW54_PARC0|nr:bifunctional [glutamate--ammonia ligase]-adenylyl-L-tyrosine phosphorylase/[glutamate--ammonia-ligase] adenylyltransferase [Paracidovorax citrulli]ABM35192.1 (Glutamate--ammonia-ligase) adenylyltransferase [Paracidovorax citrulli AAC00-1]ATG96296.1 bifunctional [glutamate--ammonia ligase]-adenylyl-L-tyrosine phosphorylase/[glutamate--ammonia-ligase] adenylyltransferase [Paracidovorax citrulli]MVT29906.1 bifunctional [glutamate--ammonia ligase]-adenylyl-L-tyrosine phosphorylase/[glutamate--amm
MSTPFAEPGVASAEHAAGAAHSRFHQRLQRRYAGETALLPPGAPTRQTMAGALQALRARGHDTGAALRVLRQLVMERLIRLDCEEGAPLSDITRATTELAELALDEALRQARQDLDARHGPPQGPDGGPVALWIVGMGKLGARELNVSSDIDVIYVYEHEGETAGVDGGRGRISHQEYFGRAVKAIHALVGETTEHGFVFRMDLALRPNGNSGPPAVSLAALEEYLQVQGREWERFAWLKSRIVAPRDGLGHPAVQGLRAVVLPFVFRRYLDYSVFDSLRSLHRQIRDHAAKRSAGHPERANDVKLSRGGIREIEFTVQLLQVVRGGQFPELRCRPTLEALQRLARAGLMPQETADALAEAYTFLRRVEHRIQYLDDQQTHVLPTRDDDLAWIASTLGLGCCAFLRQLDAHRELVAQEFDTLLGGPGKRQCSAGGCGGPRAQSAPVPEFDTLLEQLPPKVRERVAEWRDHPRVAALRDEARARLLRLVQRTARWLAEGRVNEDAAVRLVAWLEPLLRRESYLALLLERPSVHEHLMHLLGAAQWPARYMLQHPGVIDELAGDALLSERFVPADFEHEMELRIGSLRSTGEDDDEALLNLLRRAQHAETFRTLARDVERRITVEQVADDLSALADCVLRVTAAWCWDRLRNRHRDVPQFGIIGYGKLGGKELGYGSDLDIVFVFDDDDDRAPEIYAAFARKLINWLTVKTGEGDLYEIDTALRPNGSSGLLVTSFEAYANYQQRRGSNTAWTWEHQAMTRARFVLGSDALRDRFDAVRTAVITAPRDAAGLHAEIVAMRERVREAHPVPTGQFDVKHSVGGMVDAEFAVQYLVLAHAGEHPGLCDNVGNIALLQRAEAAGLLPAGVGAAAASAYRTLRQVQHRARLNEEPTRVAPSSLHTEREAVMALWRAVFGGTAAS